MESEKKNTQWHPAFCAAMCLEFLQNKSQLAFMKEYNINTKPLQMDLLVVKKSSDVQIENEIGRIFKGHNIIEFKSPDDELNLDVYMKVMGYACLYKAQEKHVNEIMPEDITLSFVRESYPRELFKWFSSNNYVVEKPYDGIYYIKKDGFFATQIVVMKELSKKNHILLSSLTREMDKEGAERLAEFVAGLTDKEDKDNADAVLQVAMHANMQLFEMLKEDETMCDALREFFKDELQEANERGLAIGTANGIEIGTASGKAEDIVEILEEKGEVSEELFKAIYSQKDIEVLKKWVKLALRTNSIDAFETAIGLVK